jgi:hypothetical protein
MELLKTTQFSKYNSYFYNGTFEQPRFIWIEIIYSADFVLFTTSVWKNDGQQQLF